MYMYLYTYIYTKAFILHLIKVEKEHQKNEEMEKLENIN